MGRSTSTPTLVGQCLALVSIAAVGSRAQHLPVPPLPYSYSALVPFISEHALRVSRFYVFFRVKYTLGSAIMKTCAGTMREGACRRLGC